MQESVSEVARLRQEIELDHLSAQLGLNGLAAGMCQHRFITTKMERVGASHAKLEQLVGPEAIALVAETINALPQQPDRPMMIRLLEHELGASEETAMLIDHLWEMWETIDLLVQRFGQDTAFKMIKAVVPSSPTRLQA